MSAQDVGCVEVVEANSELVLQTDPYYEAGYAVDAYSPIFEEHRRLAPLCRFSRSRTRADGDAPSGSTPMRCCAKSDWTKGRSPT